MNIDLKNVASIVDNSNNKEVEKIVWNYNNKMIWGSQSKYPYRRLEYIHFNGAERIQTNFYAGTRPINHQCEFTADVEVTGTDARTLIGLYNNTNGDAFARWYLIMRQANGIRTHLGSVSSNWATNFSNGDKLKMSCTYTWTSASKPCFYWYLFDQSTGGNSIGSAAPLTATTSGEFDTTHNMYLGCQYNPYASTPYYNFWIGNLYNYQRRQTNASGALLSDYVPCQRKSDNVCGMYDTITNAFLPMVGTTITDAAAGPTVEEYWDPTSNYRRLEYVHFNGNDYINSQFTPWNNLGFYIDIKWDASQKGQYNGHGQVTSNNRTFIGVDNTGKMTFGSGVTSSSISNSDPYTRHTYQVNTSSSSAGKFYIDGTQIWSGNSNYQETNRGTIYVGAVYRNSSDYAYCKANIYNVRFINNVSTSSFVTWNWIPVQRKIDGAIGFLNIRDEGALSPTFITSVNGLLEAGPVVDENWDQTNPF